MTEFTKQAKYRVVIAVPAGDTVKAGFAHDLARLVGATTATRPDIQLRLQFYRSSLIPMSRTELVKGALSRDSTHIFFLDSDMRFPADALARMLDHREPIVAASYVTRNWPIMPVARFEGKPFHVKPGATGLHPVDWVGMGVMLIDLDVFRGLALPWFHLLYHPDTNEYSGEDVFFAMHANASGLKLLVDQDVSQSVMHVGEMEYEHGHGALAAEETPAPLIEVVGA